MSMIARLAGVLVLLLAASIAQAQNKVPAELALEALVKASLLSFNDANITGNYTVFHARLSKPFREQFPPERLKETFKDFSQKHIDIHVVAAFKPTYAEPSMIDPDGKLDVKNVDNQITWLQEQGFVDKGFAADAIIAKEYVKAD